MFFWNFIICNIIPRPFPIKSSACITQSVGNISLNSNQIIIITKFLGIWVFWSASEFIVLVGCIINIFINLFRCSSWDRHCLEDIFFDIFKTVNDPGFNFFLVWDFPTSMEEKMNFFCELFQKIVGQLSK